MNKKVSTIFAMAALMGGSLFSSAYAADLLSAFVGNTPTKVDLSKQYFIQVGTDYLRAEVDPDTKVVTYSFVDASTVTIDQEDVKAYLWTLSASKQANGKTGYEIKNAESGELIRINASTETVVTTADTNDAGYKDIDEVMYDAYDNAKERLHDKDTFDPKESREYYKKLKHYDKFIRNNEEYFRKKALEEFGPAPTHRNRYF